MTPQMVAGQVMAADRAGAGAMLSLRLALAAFFTTLAGLVGMLVLSIGVPEPLRPVLVAVSLVILFGIAPLLSLAGLLFGMASMASGQVREGLKGVVMNIAVLAVDAFGTLITGLPLFALMSFLGYAD